MYETIEQLRVKIIHDERIAKAIKWMIIIISLAVLLAVVKSG